MTPSSLPDEFRCDVSHEPHATRVSVVGDLDMATAPDLDAQVSAVLQEGVERLILDLRGLRFIDSSGLHAIARLNSRAKRDGFSLALIPGSPAVQRVFELTGMSARLPFVDG